MRPFVVFLGCVVLALATYHYFQSTATSKNNANPPPPSKGEPRSVRNWPKSVDADGITTWTMNNITYSDSNGDGCIDFKKIGSIPDSGISWHDSDHDGFFDSVYKHTFGGGKYVSSINVAVPKTK